MWSTRSRRSESTVSHCLYASAVAHSPLSSSGQLPTDARVVTSFTGEGSGLRSRCTQSRRLLGSDPLDFASVMAGTLDDAWRSHHVLPISPPVRAFRWGPSFGTPYTNTQFPARPVNTTLKRSTAYRHTPQNGLFATTWEPLGDRSDPAFFLVGSTGKCHVLSLRDGLRLLL